MSDEISENQLTFQDIVPEESSECDQQESTSTGQNSDRETESSAEGADDSFLVSHELFRAYLDAKKGAKLCSGTAEKRDVNLRLFQEFLEEEQQSTVLDADYDDLETFVETRAQKGLTRETVRNKLSAMKQAYKYINFRTDYEANLRSGHFEEIMGELSDYNWGANIKRKPLDRDEVVQLYKEASKRDEMIIRVLVETALRNSDLRDIKLDHLQFDDKDDPTIYVPDSKNNESYEIPVSHKLALDIEKYIRLYRDAPRNSDYLFPAEQGPKLETNEGLNSCLKEIAEDAGIQDIIGTSPLTERQKEMMNTDQDYREWNRVIVHVLRHTGLTLMVDAGVPKEIARYIANHEQLETLEKYLHEDKIVKHNKFRETYNPP